LRGREWRSPQGEVKFFNTLNAFKVDAGEPIPVATVATDDNDLPF
jgi:hypothetical protein